MKVYGTINILGEFWPQRTSDISEVEWTSDDEGRILFDSDNDDLYYGSSSKWVKLTETDDLFSPGTNLVFASTLPTGWNIISYNDIVIVLTNNTSSIGYSTGSWYINGMQTSEGHRHFTPDGMGIPSITTAASTGNFAYISTGTHKHKLNLQWQNHRHIESGASFDGNWRPAHVKLTVGEYQG